ncbi:cysteine-rich motor neuron 1 protein-like [Dermatophagoides farinae]|uniref:cysteine-rich motor neuron 1 protein-like n=1 Tax=Dermatophagoides farinae TaxID=6954 RepID=UPI003F6080F4
MIKWSNISIENLLFTFIIFCFVIIHSTTIDSHRLNRSKRDWKSTLPVPIPKPGEYSEGYITQFFNRKKSNQTNLDEDIITIDNDNPMFDIQLNLTHRCIFGTEYNCPANFECRSLPHYDERFSVCVQVDCSMNCTNYHEIFCPTDSKIVQQMIEINGKKCCLHFCNCDETKCTVQKCPGSRPVVLKKAMKIPSKCCDQIECNPYIPKKCIGLNGEQYNPGDSWLKLDDCHRCKCIDGVQKCESIKNCPFKCLPVNHTEKLDSEQCCPRCKACIDEKGIKHDDSSAWIDNCRRCECKNEKIICNSPYGGQQFCDRPCTENERREWQNDKCCDKCECNLKCPFGFQINSTDNHSQLCKCKEIPKTKVELIESDHGAQRPANENNLTSIWILLGFAIVIVVGSFCSYTACVYLKNHSKTSKTNHSHIYEHINQKFTNNNHDDEDNDLDNELSQINGQSNGQTT